MDYTLRSIIVSIGLLFILTGCGGDESTVTADPSTPPDSSSAGYSMADLEGTWGSRSLVAGGDFGWSGWVKEEINIDSSGLGVFSMSVDSDGNTALPANQSFSMTEDGVVTIAEDASFHATMGKDKESIVATLDNGTGENELRVFYRQPMDPVIADFEGEWDGHTLFIVDGGANAIWGYGSMTVNALGETNDLSGEIQGGDSFSEVEMAFSISAEEDIKSEDIFGLQGSFYAGKDTIVATMFDDLSGMFVLQRRTGEFTMDDLGGTWDGHLMGAGGAIGPVWGHGRVSIDSTGVATWTEVDYSDGSTTLPANQTLSISASGIIASAEDLTYHGTMSGDKNTIVATFDNTDSGSVIMYLQKR